MSVENRRSTY